jgi:hypothetical protein
MKLKLKSPARTTVSRHVNSPVAAPADPTLPVDDGGVVKNSTAALSDTDARKFATTQNAAMVDNPNFTVPLPSLGSMDAAVADLKAMDENVRLAKVALADAYGQRAASRATLDTLIKARAAYIQLASNGNTSVIIGSGFPVRSAPVPVGQLDAPTNLSIDLNVTA